MNADKYWTLGVILMSLSGCIAAGDGDDVLGHQRAMMGVNEIHGTPYDDDGVTEARLTGSDADRDTIYGYAGADILDGMGSDDRLYPGADGAADRVYGGAGNDIVGYTNAAGPVTVDLAPTGGNAYGLGDGQDELYSIERIFGSPHDDTLLGDDNDNLIDGGGGSDTLDGRGGIDRVAFSFLSTAVVVVMEDANALAVCGNTGIAVTGYGTPADTTTFDNFESVYGTQSHDTIRGTAGNDVIYGAGGDDRIYAGDGSDELVPGPGDDTVILGAGYALIRVSPGHGADRIYGFTDEDRIDLRWFNTTWSSLSINPQGNDVVVSIDGSPTLTFRDSQLTLTESHFWF